MANHSPFPAQVRPFRWSEIGDDVRSEDGVAPEAAPEATPRIDPEAVLEAARKAAEAILDRARAEAEALKEEARATGLEAGKREGLELAAEAAGRWESLAAELADQKANLYEQARSRVVELVLALVGKIIGPLAEGDREAVVRVAGRALQALSEREVLTVRVNPEDLQGLLDAKPRLLQALDGIKKLTVLEDPSVGRGGCLVESATTEIDGRLDAQLGEIARALRKA